MVIFRKRGMGDHLNLFDNRKTNKNMVDRKMIFTWIIIFYVHCRLMYVDQLITNIAIYLVWQRNNVSCTAHTSSVTSIYMYSQRFRYQEIQCDFYLTSITRTKFMRKKKKRRNHKNYGFYAHILCIICILYILHILYIIYYISYIIYFILYIIYYILYILYMLYICAYDPISDLIRETPKGIILLSFGRKILGGLGSTSQKNLAFLADVFATDLTPTPPPPELYANIAILCKFF